MLVDRTNFYTWNPILHFQLLRGGPKDFDDELRRRTVMFQYVDRAKAYDTIEWQLNNTDGMLLRPEYLALGVIVRVRLGYTNCEAPWHTFLINRVRGDPGIYNATNPVTGRVMANVHHGRSHTAATVTYTGRNRNAQAPKGGKKTTKKKGTTYYGPTADIASQDYAVSMSKGPRIFPGRSTAECVRNLAAALGFHEHMQLVQDTNDNRDGLRIPSNVPDGAYLMQLARDKGFIYRIDEDGFHFHHPRWAAGKGAKIIRDYIVGGQDIIKVAIDGDFRLPSPSSMKTVGRNLWLRHRSEGMPTVTRGELYITDLPPGVADLPEEQRKNLQRDYVVPISDAGRMADDKAMRNFINAKLKSYKIVVDIVGDPIVRATNLVRLAGTGTPLVDGVWYVEEVKHQFSGAGGQTYVTTLTLKQAPKVAAAGNTLRLNHRSEGMPTTTRGELWLTDAPAALLKQLQPSSARR